jgi:hypothetical protein
MFNYRGDSNDRHNLPEQPELDFVLGLFAVIGLGYALTRLRDPVYFLFVSGFFILMCPGFFTIEAPQSLRTILAAPVVIFFILTAMSGCLNIFSKKINPFFTVMALAAVLAASCAENSYIYFDRQATDPRCYMGFSTQEYEAGGVAQKALAQGMNVVTASYYLNHASFKFALKGSSGCAVFKMQELIPAKDKRNKNFVWLLPAEYIYLTDYMKTLFPDGTIRYFNNRYNGDLIFYTFEAPFWDLQNLNPGAKNQGAKVIYYGDHGYKNEILRQKVPAILLTWYDQTGLRILSADWQAGLEIQEPGAYEFNLSSRGDAWVYIDAKMTVHNPAMPVRCDRGEGTGTIYLKKGIHTIEVKYETGAETGAVNYSCNGLWLLWKKPKDAKFSDLSGNLETLPER